LSKRSSAIADRYAIRQAKSKSLCASLGKSVAFFKPFFKPKPLAHAIRDSEPDSNSYAKPIASASALAHSYTFALPFSYVSDNSVPVLESYRED
jgi:hypothetical protein